MRNVSRCILCIERKTKSFPNSLPLGISLTYNVWIVKLLVDISIPGSINRLEEMNDRLDVSFFARPTVEKRFWLFFGREGTKQGALLR